MAPDSGQILGTPHFCREHKVGPGALFKISDRLRDLPHRRDWHGERIKNAGSGSTLLRASERFAAYSKMDWSGSPRW